MRCPFCSHEEDKVVDSRGSGDAIRRRRECLACGRRFTTYEYVERAPLVVIKRDGSREDFKRDKLESGIRVACAKRPVSHETIRDIVTEIHNELTSSDSSEVSYDRIGNMVMKRLASIDHVAYVRFASVYRRFEDVGEFAREVDQMGRQAELN